MLVLTATMIPTASPVSYQARSEAEHWREQADLFKREVSNRAKARGFNRDVHNAVAPGTTIIVSSSAMAGSVHAYMGL